jgi:alpha-glucoside transport system substrate-binding protein
VSRPTRRTFARARAQLRRTRRPAAIDRAVSAVRSDVPPLPPDIDHRVLSAIRADSAADIRPARSARRVPRHGLWTMLAASALFLVALLLFPPGPAPDSGQAVASVQLTSSCDAYTRAVGARSQNEKPPLVVAGPWGKGEAKAFMTVLEHFSVDTGIPVVYAYQTRDIAKTLRKRLDRYCPPDVALLPQPGLLRELAQHGDLVPIAAATQRLVKDNQGALWRRIGSVNNRLYGVWFKAANKSTVWYSRRTFAEHGVRPAGTWSQLRRAATTLDDAGVAPFSLAGQDGWTLTDWFENIYLRTAGGKRYNQLAAHEIPWTHRSVGVALEHMSDMLRRDWLLNGRSGRFMTTSFETSVDDVFRGRSAAAMVYEGDFVTSQIEAAHADDAGVFRFPAIAGSEPSSVVVGGDVATLMTKEPEGQRLVRYLATVKAARLWVRAGGISPNRRLPLDAYRDTTTRRLAHALVHAKQQVFDLADLQPPAFGAASDKGMRKILRDFLSGTADVNRVMRELEAAAKAARSRRGGSG